MTHHPIHQPATHQPPAPDNHDHADYPGGLTPAQHAQLQALVTHAVTIAAHSTGEDTITADQQAWRQRPLSTDPGMAIALVALALVAIVAIVAVFIIALGG